MQTKNQISLTRKTLYVVMLLGVFLSAFGAGNLPSVRAQEAWTETPIPANALKPTEMPPLSATISERSPDQGPIRLWYDTRGDLWVETPFYRWNITSGMSITALSGSKGYEWSANSQEIDARVIDGLFFIASADAPTTTRIFYALPNEAVVYLERKATNGAEGLELAFRASDGLVRFTHRWQGSNYLALPLPQQSPLISHTSQIENQSGVFPPQGRQLNDGWSYSLSFDPIALQGQSFIWQLGIQSSQIPKSSCFTQYPSTDPAAHNPCQFPDFFLPGQVLGTEYLFLYTAELPTAPLNPVAMVVSALQLTLPDMNVANIARTPRYDYNASKNNPTPGDIVTFQARIANRGGQSTGVFQYAWYIDQVLVQSNTYPNLNAGEEISLSLNWTWQDGPHMVRLNLDPSNVISEVSEQNNNVEDRTNGLAVGFWVEQSVYDYFNIHQVELGLGSVSWDDWAQRQIRFWNQMMADAIHPLTPQGVIDRVRLDKVTVVPDGTLPHPYPDNFPDVNDKTVDMMWGFDAELVGPNGLYVQDPSAQNLEPSLLHELSHARYLLDLYGLDVGFVVEYLDSDVTSTATTLTVKNNVETSTYWPLPAYLAIEGELVICQAKSGNSFVNCLRGAEGTIPRVHPVNAIVNQAAIRVQDGQGNLILTSSAMPLVGLWDDHVYYNRYPTDLMSGGLAYETHSAYAWNRIAGQRPVCGNYNAPCNIGEYANDLPQHNVVEIRDVNGQPIYGARVELFQAKPYVDWYAKLYLNTPDATYYTNTLGHADLGHFPFGSGPTIIHTDGHSDANLLLKISYGAQSFYRFFEVTEANEAYWSGQQNIATYILDVNFPYQCPTIADWKGEYWNNESVSGDPVLCRNDVNLDFEWEANAPAPSIGADHFSARWTRDVNFAAGIYTFEMFHDDGARLYIDNVQVFENWCSDCRTTDTVTQSLSAGIHSIRYEMRENIGLAATKLIWLPTLTVSKSGSGSGTVTSSPSGINCGSVCSYAFADNTVVTLTATPISPSTFRGWSGAGCSGTGTCIVTMSSAQSVTATFNSLPTDIALSSTAVNQNQPIGTVVGTFSSTDPDAGDTFTYSLVAGAGSTDNASFSISGNQLRTAAVFDFATKSSYSIRVRSTDSGSLFFDKEFTITVNSPAPPTTLVNSILPTSRSIQVGTLATVFHTVINAGANPAIGVTLSMASAPAGTFAYQQTDCATNAVLGSVNPSLDLAPGGVLCYVLSFTPSATFSATSVHIRAQASNAPSTTLLTGINTWLLRSTSVAGPDIIALTTTTDFHQIACSGANAFAVALSNVGAAATGDITAVANTGSTTLPLSISISETDPATGAVIGDHILQTVGAGENRTVAVFVTFNGCIAFDPAANRIFIEFRDASNNVVGSTSTAVSTGR